MIRRLFRWGLYLFIIVVVLAVAGILLLDTAAKNVAESKVRSELGMDVKIGKFAVGLASPTVTIEQFTLFNKAEFGGAPFIKMPELHVEYDRDALALGKLKLKLVRLNLEEIHIIEDQYGNTNIEALEKQAEKTSGTSTNKSDPPVKFEGIDTLNLTIKKAKFTSAKNPKSNRDINFNIENEIFRNIKSEKDLQAVAMTLALRKGASFLLESALSSPDLLLKGATNAPGDARKLLESLIPRK